MSRPAHNKVALVGEIAVPCCLQSAIAGMNSHTRTSLSTVWTLQAVLKERSYATGSREPCQVGNQAALSGSSRVPWDCRSRAGCKETGCSVCSNVGVRSCYEPVIQFIQRGGKNRCIRHYTENTDLKPLMIW